MDDPRSFGHAIFRCHRDRFLSDFEGFLTSLETPIGARRFEALETEELVSAIVDRLKAMRVI